MKVNYLPKNKFKNPYLKRILVIVLIFLLGAFLISFFEKIIISGTSAFWGTENVFIKTLEKNYSFFNTQKSLVEENFELKEKLSNLESELILFKSNQFQERNLLELLGRIENTDALVATVLTRPPQSPFDVIFIDAGLRESIVRDLEVLLPEGGIIGSVTEVYPKSSKVELFSSNGVETSAVLERNNLPVILVGTGAGNFSLAVPRDVYVEKGDKIVSSRITSDLLAIVEDVSVKSTDSFKTVLAKSPTNIFALRFVFIEI